jgi:hypothetical protein
VPLRAVGWLEHPAEFNQGVAPVELLPKLRQLVESAREKYPHYYFRGVHACSLCAAAGCEGPGPVWSQENIFVPGSDEVFVAPGGIVHYVEEHNYLPPDEFIKAVLTCPEYGSEEFVETLRSANGGHAPPLETKEAAFASLNMWRRRDV